MSDRAVPRSLDWRFLLPDPGGEGFDHLVLLGGTEEDACTVAACGIARRVSRELPAAGPADAVVAVGGVLPCAEKAAGALRPGGVLYVEVDRRRTRTLSATPARVGRALQRAALTLQGSYGVLPGLRHARVRFPLERPEALDWYIRTLFPEDSAGRLLAGAVMRAATRLPGSALGALLPCFAVVASAGPAAPPSMLGHPGLPEALRRPGLQPLLLTHGDADGSRVALLPFAPGERWPAAVLKGSRLAARSGNTENEQRVLRRLRSELPPVLARAVPEPLGILAWGGVSVGVESCVPGRVLAASTARRGTTRRRRVENLELGAGWLTELHRQGQLGRTRWDAERLVDFEVAFGPTPAQDRLFAAVRDRAEALRDLTLPLVWQHWGFGEWNVYRDGDRIQVIDWEGGEPGLPLWDLLHFATHWYASAERVSPLAAVGAIFLQPANTDRAVFAARSVIDRYMDALAIDRRLLPVLLVGYWVSRSLGRLDPAGRGTVVVARAGNAYVPFVDTLAAGAEALFT